MLRKCMLFILSGMIAVNSSGCVLLLAGAAGGAGTAAWLSNKLVQEVDADMDKSVKAVKSALKSLHLGITKEVRKDDVAQIKGEYYDGKTIWVDVHKVTPENSRIEVRVGVTGDEEATRKIMDKILRYL